MESHTSNLKPQTSNLKPQTLKQSGLTSHLKLNPIKPHTSTPQPLKSHTSNLNPSNLNPSSSHLKPQSIKQSGACRRRGQRSATRSCATRPLRIPTTSPSSRPPEGGRARHDPGGRGGLGGGVTRLLEALNSVLMAGRDGVSPNPEPWNLHPTADVRCAALPPLPSSSALLGSLRFGVPLSIQYGTFKKVKAGLWQ